MTTPGWYPLLLLGLAAFRSWRIVGIDSVLDRPRSRLPAALVTFLECPWCAGFWIALGWWAGYQLDPHWALVAATPLAIATIAAAVWSLPV